MTATIPDLWPGLKLDILAPATILKQQVEYIRAKGQGVLDAELTTVTGKDDFVIYRLDLIAPLVQGQRYRVLIATHRNEYYPIQIEADCYRPKTRTVTLPPLSAIISGMNQSTTTTEALTWPPENDWRKIARNQAELITIVGEVLKSAEVRSAIESFVARSNELKLAPPAADAVEPQSAA